MLHARLKLVTHFHRLNVLFPSDAQGRFWREVEITDLLQELDVEIADLVVTVRRRPAPVP